MSKLTIAVVDDHHLFRKGLIGVLAEDAFPGAVLWEAANGIEAIDLAIEYQPKVMFMDISMPVLSGYEASKRILALFPETKIIALTTFDELSLIANLFRIGVRGFLNKNIDGSVVEAAVRAVLIGDYYYHSKYDELIGRWMKKDLEMKVPTLEFTERELQLVIRISKGDTSQQIATQLAISVRSVDTYRADLMRKVGVANTSELVSFFYRTGVLSSF